MSAHIETLGALKSPKDVRDYVASAPMALEFPKEFSLEHAPIKDQGMTGSCVAHALSSAVEYFNKLQEGTDVTFSTTYIYGNRLNTTHKEYGMYIREALANLVKYGVCPLDMLPGNNEVPIAINEFNGRAPATDEAAYPNRIISYYAIHDANTAKLALMNEGPLVICQAWYPGGYVNPQGILCFDNKTEPSYHCMLVYGWNESGWLVQNSWGKGWGKQGTCIIPYSNWWGGFEEMWGVIDTLSHRARQLRIEELAVRIEALHIDMDTKMDELDELTAILHEIQQYTDLLQKQKAALQDLDSRLVIKQKELQEIARLKELIKQNEEALAQLEAQHQNLTDLEEQIRQRKLQLVQILDELDQAELEKQAIENEIMEIKKPFQTPIGQIIAKIINFIIRLLTKTK